MIQLIIWIIAWIMLIVCVAGLLWVFASRCVETAKDIKKIREILEKKE